MVPRADASVTCVVVGRTRLGCLSFALIALAVLPQGAGARAGFRPRIAGAMGIVPAHGRGDLAAGKSIPVVYHGGSVMRGVTVHTVFWAPAGYRFDGSPGPGIPGYEQLVQRFFTDVAHDSLSHSNVFSVLPQYAGPGGPGRYAIRYAASADSIDVSNAFPRHGQCASPASIVTCVTDRQVQHELDRVIQEHDRTGRGLHDLWFVFLPPDVDTCILPGECGTTAYAGYHSLSNIGHGTVIYALVPDPLIEFTPPPGADPQGNPEAESTLDTSAHETVEAITDPEGTGWMDPNGFEVGDKCEFPEDGTPLGYASNGSPYNQVINGDRYLIQMMWSNPRAGCVQRSLSSGSAPRLATVDLTQFSPLVRGNIGARRSGVEVQVALLRAGSLTALGATRTRRDGSWGPVELLSESGAPRSPSDDRDVVIVRYGRHGPKPDLIATGDGGNPFTESGWTGWFDLDSGFALRSQSVRLAPCGQTGVLSLHVNGALTEPPVEHCDTESDVATVKTRPLGPGSRIVMSSEDNRAVVRQNPAGALIRLSVVLGEPGSLSALQNDQNLLVPSGLPSCTADLRAQEVRCSGLRARARYTLGVAAARSDGAGSARFVLAVRRGAVLTLRNRARRVLTRLHVAHLRVDITGDQTVVAGGSCEAGEYWGLPLSRPPISPAIGLGIAGRGVICPAGGRAAGLSVASISQIDDRSGGVTRTEVPEIVRTTPLDGATLYGRFVAVARSGLPGPHGSTYAGGTRIGLTIKRGGHTLFRAANVDTARGVPVRRLPRGLYTANWVLRDANGDTRTIRTQFVEAR
jgi:hypothetical protein